MGGRRRSREYALQVLFQLDLAGRSPAEVLDQFWSGVEAEPAVREFTEQLVHGVTERRAALDRRIASAAEHWRLERMAVVDRNVLRMALHELLCGTSPAAVVIDEAVEIAKRFGGEGSGAFVHGLLDSIRAELERASDAAPRPTGS